MPEYLSQTQKYLYVFASQFDNLKVIKYDSVGDTEKQVTVPIMFGHSSKIYIMNTTRLATEFRNTTKAQIMNKYPRITLKNVLPVIDKERLLHPRQTISDTTQSAIKGSTYVPLPYKINLTMEIVAKNITDAYQLYEQITTRTDVDICLDVKLIADYPSFSVKITSDMSNIDYPTELVQEQVDYVKIEIPFIMDVYYIRSMTPGQVITTIIDNIYVVSELNE